MNLLQALPGGELIYSQKKDGSIDWRLLEQLWGGKQWYEQDSIRLDLICFVRCFRRRTHFEAWFSGDQRMAELSPLWNEQQTKYCSNGMPLTEELKLYIVSSSYYKQRRYYCWTIEKRNERTLGTRQGSYPPKKRREKEVQREKGLDDSVAVPFRFVRYRQEY